MVVYTCYPRTKGDRGQRIRKSRLASTTYEVPHQLGLHETLSQQSDPGAGERAQWLRTFPVLCRT